ncbi:hypothetical protein LguiB_013574 [Lonicera macranthoides]
MATRVSSRSFPYAVLSPPHSSTHLIQMRVPYTSLSASVFNRSLISSCCETGALKEFVFMHGKEKFPEEKLPIKTDQGTLREGYRKVLRLSIAQALIVIQQKQKAALGEA